MKRIFIYITLLFLSCTINAQQAITNNGNLQLHSGASMSGFGNFTNISTATLTNGGSLYVRGNVLNDQSGMSIGTGTLYLNGTAAQSVGGAQPFRTYHLNTDNTAGITLNSNLSVSGVHTFANGLIASSATPNYLIYESGSSYTGATDARHVTGWVKKIGTTNFDFPVGDATYLRTAAVVGLWSSSEINCHYYRPTSNVFSLTAPLVQVNANEYWQMDEISGGNAQIRLNWDNSKVAFDNVLLSEIRVGYYTGGSWRSGGGTGTGNVTTTGNVTSWIGSSFSFPMTFGYASDVLLPLKLISFTAARRTGTSYLHWITESEKGADRFEIERSYDGVSFTRIGHTAARNTSARELYDYEDRSALQGIAYYRIKMIDADGKFIYTQTVAVTENQLQNNTFMVLNPVRSVMTIFNKSGYDGKFDYRLFNAGGQLVMKGDVSMVINGSAVIPLSGQPSAGIYVLELSNSQTMFRQKILIEK